MPRYGGELSSPANLPGEEREFKGHLSVPLKDVPELEGVKPGMKVEVVVQAEVMSVNEDKDEARVELSVMKFGYLDEEESLEQARKNALKAVERMAPGEALDAG